MVALPRREKRNQMQATPASGSSNFAGVAIFKVILPSSPFLYKAPLILLIKGFFLIKTTD